MLSRSSIEVLLPLALWHGCWQFPIMITAVIVAVLLIVTRSVTTFRFQRALSSDADVKRIPPFPYTIPVVGHAFYLALDIIGLNRDIAFVAFQTPNLFHCEANTEKISISRPSCQDPSFHDRHLRCNRT